VRLSPLLRLSGRLPTDRAGGRPALSRRRADHAPRLRASETTAHSRVAPRLQYRFEAFVHMIDDRLLRTEICRDLYDAIARLGCDRCACLVVGIDVGAPETI